MNGSSKLELHLLLPLLTWKAVGPHLSTYVPSSGEVGAGSHFPCLNLLPDF